MATRISPQLFDARPDLLAVQTSQILPGQPVAATFTRGTRLTRVFYDPVGSPLAPVSSVTVTLNDLPLAIAENSGATFVLTPTSLLELDWQGDGGVLTAILDAGFQPRDLRYVPLYTPLVVALADQQAALLSPGGVIEAVNLPDGGGPLTDINFLAAHGINGINLPYMLAIQGGAVSAFTVPLSATVPPLPWAWSPLPLTSTDGGTFSLERFVGADPNGGSTFVFAGPDAGVDYDVDLMFHQVVGSCVPCPPGSTYAGLDVYGGLPIRCHAAQGDLLVSSVSWTGGLCGEATLVDDAATVGSQYDAFTAPGGLQTAFWRATAHGALVAGSSLTGKGASGAGLNELIPDQPLQGFESSVGLYAVDYQRSLLVEPGLGLFAFQDSYALPTCGQRFDPPVPVRGEPSWLSGDFISALNPVSPAEPGACLAQTNGEILGMSAAAPGADGNVVVLGVVGGVLALGVVTPSIEDGGAPPVTLEDTLAPFGGIDVTDLVLVQLPADAGLFAQGYALSTAGLSSMTAFAPRSWASAPLSLPLGNPVRFLSDGSSARIAYDDGRIFTLPSRLQVSEALDSLVLDFTTLEGTDLVVTDVGLFGLAVNPDGGPIAVWQPVAVPPSSTDPNAAPGDFAQAAFVPGTGQAWLMTQWGTVYRLTVDGGSP